MSGRASLWVGLSLVFLAVISRWLPHPPNFSPLIGIALFAGSRFSSRWTAVGVPLIALMVSDLFLGWHNTLPFVYGALILMALGGYRWLKPAQFGWGRLGTLASGAAGFFFVVSNLAVWLVGGLYSPDLSGLVTCFVAAIPFFPATLVSGLVYSFALFALASIADVWTVTEPVKMTSRV